MFSASCRTGLILLLVSAACQAASTTTAAPSPASADSAQANLTSTTVAPAIIAIEIVDPTANQTVANRNTKRTIEANLGYGHQAPKLEYYKYSQEDIPAYNGGAATEIFGATTPEGGAPAAQQQQYPQAPGLQQLYQPGTMLFSQLNNQGQLSQLTAGPPLNTNIQQPVIVVRVRPDQLNSLANGLFPNLPQSHPFAANLNNVDLSSLLSGYAQNALQGQGGGLQYPQPQGFEQAYSFPQQHQQFQGYPGFDFGGGQQVSAAPGGYDFGGAQGAQGPSGFDFSGAQHLAPGVSNFDFTGGQQQLLAQGPQLFQQPYQQAAAFPQQGGFQFPTAQFVFPQAPGAHQPQQPLLQQVPQHEAQQQQQPQQQQQQTPLQTFENYPDNAHTRVIFKGSAEPSSASVPASPISSAPVEKAKSAILSKNNDEDENNHESEYSSYSSSSSDDGYHYDKPVKETKKLFTAAENDGDYKAFPSPAGGSGFDISSFQPSSYSDYDGEQTQQKDVNEREPFSYSYSTITSSGSPTKNSDRSKKSTNSNNNNNNNNNNNASSKIRMRVPKSLRQSSRDKREKLED